MNSSEDLLFYIFGKIYNIIFTIEIAPDVKIGWVIITIILFIMIISSVMNVPRGLGYGPHFNNEGKYVENGFYRKRIH